MLIIFSGLILRILLSFYNVNYEFLPGASNDAIKYHEQAIVYYNYFYNQISDDNLSIFLRDGIYQYNIGWVYSVFLGHLYNIFGTSYIVSSIFSCLVWLISAITFRYSLIKLKIKMAKVNLALFAYTFLFPTSIIYTSLTLREVYMLCITNLLVLLLIFFKDQKNFFHTFTNTISIFFLIVLLSSLHKSNLITSVLFIMSVVIYFILKKINLTKKGFIYLITISISIFYFTGTMEYSFEKIQSYQLGHFHPVSISRASYYLESDITNLYFSFSNFFFYIFENFYNYFIQPSIFNISTPKDVILALENFFRLVMIFYVIKKLYLKKMNSLFYILVILFFLSEIPYSQATINWGTSSRHHVQVIGLLILLALYPKTKYKNE
jgi:hypothetical protein